MAVKTTAIIMTLIIKKKHLPSSLESEELSQSVDRSSDIGDKEL